MLPLPLKWCMIGGTLTATTHIIITTIEKVKDSRKSTNYVDDVCIVKQMVANSLLYVAINFAGMYTKYLTDRGQRLAFIETHKAMEHKKESEKEYQKTQRLLDSSKYIFHMIEFKYGQIQSKRMSINHIRFIQLSLLLEERIERNIVRMKGV